jgi:hypothetical protein
MTEEAQVYSRGHDYLSTACLHGEHDYCKSTVGAVGPKVASVCKFCGTKCRCQCHQEESNELAVE